MAQLVPVDGRRAFYAALSGDVSDYNYRRNPQIPFADQDFLSIERVFAQQAMGALDLELGMDRVQDFFAEAALAGKFYLDTPYRPLPFYALKPLFDVQVIGDEAALAAMASAYRERLAADPKKKPIDPHLETLARALAASALGDDKSVRAALKEAKQLPPKSRRALHAPWFAALTAVADACLIGKPRDLSALLVSAAVATKKYFTKNEVLEDGYYEPYLARFALAFVGRARARGFDVAGPNPDPSIRLDLLCLPPRKLPLHAWHTWPKPPPEHWQKIQEAYALEKIGAVRRDEGVRPAGKSPTKPAGSKAKAKAKPKPKPAATGRK